MPPTPHPGEGFSKGPVPLGWKLLAKHLGKQAAYVGDAVWYKALMDGTDTVRLTRKLRAKFLVVDCRLGKTLAKMAQAGLISVESKPGRAPLVTLRPTPVPRLLKLFGEQFRGVGPNADGT